MQALELGPMESPWMRRQAADLLAETFVENAAMAALAPDVERRRTMLRRWYRSLTWLSERYGRRPLLGARAGGRLVGAASTYAPGRYPPPVSSAALQLPAFLGVGLATAVRSKRWHDARAAAPPRAERFVYLELIGVEAECRGRGVGRALLGAIVEQAEALRAAVVLHTNDPGTVAFYERAGFDATHRQSLPIGVEEWLMERPAHA